MGVVCPVFPCIAEGVTSTVVIGEACDAGGVVKPPPFNSGELVRGVDGLECEGVSIGEIVTTGVSPLAPPITTPTDVLLPVFLTIENKKIINHIRGRKRERETNISHQLFSALVEHYKE